MEKRTVTFTSGGQQQKEALQLAELQKRIGYVFRNPALLERALTHTSRANETHAGHAGSNERLEFLGDAVLELVSSEFFYHRYPELTEGQLTVKRASFVCEPALAFCAEQIPLGEFLRLGRGEEQTGGRFRPSVVSDAMEAVIGAIYLDGGFAPARAYIEHLKEFSSAVLLDGKELARGTGRSKKRSEQQAAYEALKRMGIVKDTEGQEE